MVTFQLNNVNRATYDKFVQELQKAHPDGEVASRIDGKRATLTITDAKGVTLVVGFDLPDLDVPTANGKGTDLSGLADKLKGMLNDLGKAASPGGSPSRVTTDGLVDLFRIFALLLKVAQKQSEANRKMAAADSKKLQATAIAQGNERLSTGMKASSEQLTGAIVSGVMCGISTVMSAASFGVQVHTMAKQEVRFEGAKLDTVQKQFNSADKIDATIDPDVKFSKADQEVLFKGNQEAGELFGDVTGHKPVAENVKQDVVSKEQLKVKENADVGKKELVGVDMDKKKEVVKEIKNDIKNVEKKEIELVEIKDDKNNVKNPDVVRPEGEAKLGNKAEDPLNSSFLDDKDLPDLEFKNEKIGVADEAVVGKKTIDAKKAYDTASKEVEVQQKALNGSKDAQKLASVEYESNATPENAKKLEDANKAVKVNDELLDKAKLDRAEKAVAFRESLQADIAKYKEDHNVGVGMKLKNKFLKLSETDQKAFDNAKMLDRFQASVDAKLKGSIVDGLAPRVKQFRAEYEAALDLASKSSSEIYGNAAGTLAPLIKQFGDMGSAVEQSYATETQAKGESESKFKDAEQEAVRGRLEEDRNAQRVQQDAIRTLLGILQQILQIEAQSVQQANA